LECDVTQDAGDRPTRGEIVRRDAPPTVLSLRPNRGLLKAVPGLARVASASAWRAASWSVGASLATTNYVVRKAMDGEAPAAILQEAATDLREAALRLLGLPEQPQVVRTVDAPVTATPSMTDLQRRGSELIRRSNDVHVVEDTHPAFARILSEITPDEARILRFLYLDGPQPSIDVRTNRPLGIGSTLIAGGLSMIAEHAGCVHVDRVHPYLTNLARLGLIEFSKEQVSNPKRYQVVEAQPKVVEALKRAGRMPKMVQRSILLTSFGEEFCRTCLPLGGMRRTGQLDPADGTPLT
jgi:hypothetical protein